VTGEGKTTSWSWQVFRVVFAAVGLLTAFGASHALRYALCGILVLMIVGECVWSRWTSRHDSGNAEAQQR
jgi:hypothetical protein